MIKDLGTAAHKAIRDGKLSADPSECRSHDLKSGSSKKPTGGQDEGDAS
jgi:hypothetical protein